MGFLKSAPEARAPVSAGEIQSAGTAEPPAVGNRRSKLPPKMASPASLGTTRVAAGFRAAARGWRAASRAGRTRNRCRRGAGRGRPRPGPDGRRSEASARGDISSSRSSWTCRGTRSDSRSASISASRNMPAPKCGTMIGRRGDGARGQLQVQRIRRSAIRSGSATRASCGRRPTNTPQCANSAVPGRRPAVRATRSTRSSWSGSGAWRGRGTRSACPVGAAADASVARAVRRRIHHEEADEPRRMTRAPRWPPTSSPGTLAISAARPT